MPTLTIRIDEDMRDRLNEAAEERGVSTSTYVRNAVEEHFRLEDGDLLEQRPGESLELSPFERQTLVLLHRATLAAKGDLGNEYYDSDSEMRSIQVLEHGFTSEYAGQEFAGIYDPMPQSEGELVWDILDMFRVIKFSAKELGNSGWEQLKLKNAEMYGTFSGFDLNDEREARMLTYTQHLVESGRWEEQKEFVIGRTSDRGNSHRRMLDTYRAMLRVFKPLWKKAVRGFGRQLTADDLCEVLKAAGATESLES